MTEYTTDDRILNGARELFRRYGLKSVTMDDLSRHLGISKKTLYQSYADKNDLVHSFISTELNMYRNTCGKFADSSKNAIDEIIQIMQFMGSNLSGMNPNLFHDMQRHHPEAWKEFREFREKFINECIISNLEKGKKEGLYRENLNSNILARLRMEEVEMVFNLVVFPPDKFNLAEVHIALLDYYLHGICTLKGHKLINKYREINEEE